MIHKYKYEGLNILLDVHSGSIHVIDDIVYDVLDFQEPSLAFENLKDRYSEEEIREALEDIEQLVREGLLFGEDQVFLVHQQTAKQPVIKAMCLHIAHDCNLACRYCFASQGDFKGKKEMMSYETGKKALEFLVKASGNRRNLEVDFFGGEPLMNFQVVKDLVAYGRSLEEKHHKKFRFTMTTNGVLLTKEVMKYLDEEMDNVVLSLDGRQQTNDLMRPTLSGRGSYDVIVPKFKEFVSMRESRPYYLRGTFTSQNLDFSKDVVHMADLGFSSLSMEPVVSEPGLFYTIEEKHLPKIFQEYDRLAKEMMKRKTTDQEFDFFHFTVDLQGGPCAMKKALGCGAGCEYVSVTPKGEIFPCHQFVSDESFKLGDLHQGIVNLQLQKDFTQANVFTKEDCQSCWARYYCSGGCHANAYNFHQSLHKPYEIGCEMQKKRLEIAIYMKVKEMLENENR